ncbi:putative oxidoreductase C1F5.03c [Golovinomyces cichoracearum]|uniref:Putative oxidoreductase C1F5.03c n=1 Tax=Golovinomyces cichoracearum TaxID=62708 RepID=A0A420ILE9_9PEZI|nr:putative oxidoreductase C1F5.03c [Golovinomyces cichoracearum]
MGKEIRNVIIVGGGVIGATTAYYLSRHSSYDRSIHKITIIEATSFASAASGKAGGLLATWAYPSCIVPLSYQLHAELASEHNGTERWGYRGLHCASVRAMGKPSEPDSDCSTPIVDSNGWKKNTQMNNGEKSESLLTVRVPENLDWIDADTIKAYTEMGTPKNTAQVHPYLFTTSMVDLATEAGVRLIFGRVTDINYSSDSVRGVKYEDKLTKEIKELEASDVILAAGPWTSHLFPFAPVEAARAHSVIIKAQVSPYSIFTEISPLKHGRNQKHAPFVTPEIYPRPDGTVYVCGDTDTSAPLPLSSDLVTCDENECQNIIDQVSTISVKLKGGEVLKKQACYLPNLKKGTVDGPLIGKTIFKGLFLATGHSCWGIQNSCATGKLMSELIFDGKAKSANIESLDPRRLFE